MNRTKIFISSTYFDLEQVRENLRISISAMGHIPILSEHASFSVLPDLDTISNCKRNVKENCDIFILIIGGKMGSIDSISDKSIVNIEYDTAVNNNKDIFIFVDEKVNNLLEVWRKNINADFTPQVDNAKVFEFIDSIKSSRKWVFTFKKADDIVEVIKSQLSNFLKYLIDRKKAGKLDPVKEFLDENEDIQQLVIDKPDYWEYKLTAELLKSRFSKIEKKFKDLEGGLYFTRTVNINGLKYFDWVSSKFNELQKIIRISEKILNEEIIKSWGKPGTAGDQLQIKETVDKLYKVCIAAFEWELDILTFNPPDPFETLKYLLIGSGKSIFESMKDLPNKILEPLNKSVSTGNDVIQYTISLEFATPPNYIKISKELERINEDPELFFN